MQRKISLIVVTILLVCFTYAQADKQDALLSKGLSGRNVIPHMAVNSFTGDVLVVWTNNDGAGTVTIWSRLLKRRADSSYSIGKLVRLSPASGFHSSAHVVFIPWKKQFLVTWDTFDFRAGLGSGDIVGQRVKANGKAKKSSFTIVSDGYANNWPRPAIVDTGDESLPEAVRSLVLTYTAFPTDGKRDGGGVVAQALSTSKFKSKGKRVLMFPIRPQAGVPSSTSPAALELNDLEGMAFVTDILPMRKWFVIAYDTKQPFGGAVGPKGANIFPPLPRRNHNTWLLIDGPDGSIGGFFNPNQDWIVNSDAGGGKLHPIPDRNNPGVPSDDFGASFGNTRTSLFVRGAFEAEFQDDVFNGDLDGYLLIGDLGENSIDGAYLPRNYDKDIGDHAADLPLRRSAPPLDAEPAAKKPFNYWVFSAGGNIKTQSMTMKNNGKIKVGKKPTNRVFHGNALGWLEAEGIPGTGSVAIAWQKEIAGGAAEIRIHIFN